MTSLAIMLASERGTKSLIRLRECNNVKIFSCDNTRIILAFSEKANISQEKFITAEYLNDHSIASLVVIPAAALN